MDIRLAELYDQRLDAANAMQQLQAVIGNQQAEYNQGMALLDPEDDNPASNDLLLEHIVNANYDSVGQFESHIRNLSQSIQTNQTALARARDQFVSISAQINQWERTRDMLDDSDMELVTSDSDMEGNGILGRLHKSAVNLGRRTLCPEATAPNFAGENHAPCANFCGPGTRVYERIERGDKPINSADAACMQHDLDYAEIVDDQRAGRLTREQVPQRVREADNRMLEALRQTQGDSGRMLGFHRAIGQQIISAKKKLEDMGLLDPQKFVDPATSNDVVAQEGSGLSYKEQYNKKHGFQKGTSHSLEDISRTTGYALKGLQTIYNKGVGAYKTNPQSVRPQVKSKEQWAMARVYAAINPESEAHKIDKIHLQKRAAGGQEGGMLGITGGIQRRRRRRALTQQQNRDGADRIAQEFANDQWRPVDSDEYDSIVQHQAALQPLTDSLPVERRRLDSFVTRQIQDVDSVPLSRIRDDSNLYRQIQDAVDGSQQEGPFRVINPDTDPDPAMRPREMQFRRIIQHREEAGDVENSQYLETARNRLQLQERANEAYQQRQSQINRAQSQETLREQAEEDAAEEYRRQMAEYDQEQGQEYARGQLEDLIGRGSAMALQLGLEQIMPGFANVDNLVVH